MPQRPPRNLKFVSAELIAETEGRCRVHVAVEHRSSGTQTGDSEGACDELSTIQTAAEATAAAICHAVGLEPAAIAVRGVEKREAFGLQTVFVSVAAHYQSQQRQLMGFCGGEADPVRAAALALLNATNRFLNLG